MDGWMENYSLREELHIEIMYTFLKYILDLCI